MRPLLRLLAGLGAAAALAACAGVGAPPPRAGDCRMIGLWSNGTHTNFVFAAELLEPGHPIRGLFPEAGHFLVGWGERDFYMAEDAGVWRGLKAILPPSPSVLQVIAADEPVEKRVWPGEDLVPVALSAEGARRLAAAFDDALERGDDGRPVILGEGRVPGQSLFLKARGGFHLFNMCNHWSARRLREAGVPVRAAWSFTAPALMDAVRRKAPGRCPEDEIRPAR